MTSTRAFYLAAGLVMLAAILGAVLLPGAGAEPCPPGTICEFREADNRIALRILILVFGAVIAFALVSVARMRG